MHELEDEIYDDSWFPLVELHTIKDILDDALNVVSKEIYGKNRKSSKIIQIDKDKETDGYVSKLTDVINNEKNLINKVGETINHDMHEINNETNMVNEIINRASVMDNDTLHLIDDKLDKIMTQTRKKSKITPENNEDSDNTTYKTKTKNNIKTEINNKKNLINKINIRLSKAKTKGTNNIKSVYKAKCKLQDEIYLNDTGLRLDELNMIDNIFDDTLNVVWYEIHGKNRKSSKMINLCKHKKSIGKYVSKLDDIIINNIKLISAINMKINRTMSDLKNKANMVNEKIHKESVMGNLDEIIAYLNNVLKKSEKSLETIDVYITSCRKTLGQYLY